MKFKKAYMILSLCIFFLIPHIAFAQANGLNISINIDTESELPWKLNADSLTTLDNGAIIEAEGSVVLERGADILKADFARYYTATDWVFIKDNVYVKMGNDELTATEAEFDLTTSTGWLKNGSVFMSGPHIYFSGDHVTKFFGDRYSFRNATITACDGPTPAWALTAQEAKVEIDGYATLSRAAFQVATVGGPSFPYLIIPAKKTRQSGLLKPDFGISSLHGMYYVQPWFWAIDQKQDMTFYGGWFERSGTLLGLEYRLVPDAEQKLWIGADFLYTQTEKGPIGYTSDKYPIGSRENKLRYWIRSMAEGKFNDLLIGYKLNIDYVSDQDFLQDFQSSLTGFKSTRSATFEFFGRDFSELNRNRLSEGFVYKENDWLLATLGFQYSQNTSYGNKNIPEKYNPTVQQLPALNLYVYPIRLFDDLPIYFESTAQSVYFYRRYGTSGARLEMYPKVTVPFNFPYVSFLATAGVKQNIYFATTSSPSYAPLETELQKQKNASKTFFDFNIQAFTELSRVWLLNNSLEESAENIGKSEIVAFQHKLQPRLSYTYVPSVEQEKLPYYTQQDRVIPNHEINFSLVNYITSKKQQVLTSTNALNETVPLLQTSYQDLIRFTLKGGYSFQEAARTKWIDKYPKRPIKDLGLDTEFNLLGLAWTSQLYYSMYGDGITRFDLGATWPLFKLSPYLTLRTTYSQRNTMYDYQNIIRYANSGDIVFNQKVNLLRNTLTINPHSTIQVYLDHLTDLRNGETYEVAFGATYKHQCYSINAAYTYNRNESTYSISFTLPGIFD